MKRFVIAIVSGLAIGWIASLAVGDRKAPPAGPLASGQPEIDVPGQFSVPPASRAISPLSLNDQRRQARVEPGFNPFRYYIFSRDLINSLNVEQLIEAIRAGQIVDKAEIGLAFDRIAELHPMRAVELLEEVPGKGNHHAAARSIYSTWAMNDPVGLFSYLRTLPNSESKSSRAYVLAHNWMKSEPETAIAQLNEIVADQGVFETRLAGEMISLWAGKDFEAAEKWALNDSDPQFRDALYDSMLVSRLDSLEGEAAVEFALEHYDRAEMDLRSVTAYQYWASEEPKEAVAHFAAQPRDHAIWQQVERLGRLLMGDILNDSQDVAEILQAIGLLPEGELRNRYLLGAADIASLNDIEATKKIIARMTEGREREKAVEKFTGQYMGKNPVELSEWLSEQVPSPSRDTAVSKFATLLARDDLERARAWAQTIQDEGERSRVLEKLAE